jgi:ABC-type transport system involved in Fe-S cluster assembly fused permease/ATPase subunit
VALRVTNGQSTASDFVIYVAYIVQLYEPLNMLASIYRSINTALVDTEKLLKLLNEPVGGSGTARDVHFTSPTTPLFTQYFFSCCLALPLLLVPK